MNKLSNSAGFLGGRSSRLVLAKFMVCIFLFQSLQAQNVDSAAMESGYQRFHLVIGPEVSVSMHEILRVLSASGTDSKPRWIKPTAFGTGGWGLKLDDKVIGEWFPAGKTRTQTCLRLRESALLFTSNVCVVVVQPDLPLTVAGERLNKTRILVTLPDEAIMGKLLAWLLTGSAGVVSVAASGADSRTAQWRWERNSSSSFSLLLYASTQATPEVRTGRKRQSNAMATELKRLLWTVRESGKSNPLKADRAARGCYMFLERYAADAPQGARELRNQIASWLERLRTAVRGIEQARDGEFYSRPYRVAKAERARDEIVGRYEGVRTQMIRYLSKWENQLAASAPSLPAAGVAQRVPGDGAVVLSVDGVPIVHVTTGNQLEEEP